MNKERIRLRSCVIGVVVVVLAVAAIYWGFQASRHAWPRGQALAEALQSTMEGEKSDQATVARVILTNYQEVRANAARWSGVYWGCTFVSALFSALAGLILKLESLQIEEKRKKDVAAVLAVTAAILVTISTSGDFQRKWQANRIAAAELEQIGYTFLEKNGADARSFLAPVRDALHHRHMAIMGESDGETPPGQGD